MPRVDIRRASKFSSVEWPTPFGASGNSLIKGLSKFRVVSIPIVGNSSHLGCLLREPPPSAAHL